MYCVSCINAFERRPLQEAAVTKASLDAIACELGGVVSLAHRWPLLGNHDVNVVMMALQQRSLDVAWWDARKDVADAGQVPGLIGLIVNVVARRSPLTLYTTRRHWYAVRYLSVPGTWMNVDSNLERPAMVADDMLRETLRQALENDGHILIVTQAGSQGTDDR